MAELKVEGEPGLVRDTTSKAIINKDRKAWREYKARRAAARQKDATIESLQNEVSELRQMVNDLINAKPKTTRSKTKSE